MKKILIATALILSVTMMSAQPKNAADAQKAVDKAVANSQDVKKGAKPATWISLAEAYINAYELPTKNLLINSSQMEIKLFLKDQIFCALYLSINFFINASLSLVRSKIEIILSVRS